MKLRRQAGVLGIAVLGVVALSGCGRSEKLTAMKATQNSAPTTITRRWVG